MKSYSSLAWKELKAQKVTTILIIIAIILSTLMTTVIGQFIGILQSMRLQQAGSFNGYRYATFHNITDIQKEAIENDHRFSWSGNSISLGTADLKNNNFRLQLGEYDKNGLSAYPNISKLQQGRLPEKANEIALPEDALKFLGLPINELGNNITLDMRVMHINDTEEPYNYQANFILTGILENNYIGYVSGIVSGIAGQGTGKIVLPNRYLLYSTDIITEDKMNFQQTVNDVAETLNINKKKIQYNWIYLNALGIPYNDFSNITDTNSGFSYMVLAGVVIGVLVILAAALVIYNILKIAITKRIKEYGVLRAIGAESGQLYQIVAKQLFILCGIAIPIGIIGGLLSASGITEATTRLFSPEIFMVQNIDELSQIIRSNNGSKILPLLLSIAISLLSAFVAAMPAAWHAAKVSPTVAMTKTTGTKIRRNRKNKKIRSFERYYAWLNLRRNKGRTSITILSLIMSITVFVALSSFINLLNSEKEVPRFSLGDYAVTSETVGIPSQIVQQFRKLPEVSSLKTLKYSLYSQGKDGSLKIPTDIILKQPYETFQIIGIDVDRMMELFPEATQEDRSSFVQGKSCLVKNPMPISFGENTSGGTEYLVGEQFSIKNNIFSIIGNCDAVTIASSGFTNGIQIIVYDTIYNELTGIDTYTEVYPILKDDTYQERFEQKLTRICEEIPDTRWISYKNVDNQLEESFQHINFLAWGLILFIGLIGLLNIINTTYTNIHTRIQEIGMQRAIGMSTASLYKTFLWEGVYYGIIATVVGGIMGYLSATIVEAAILEKFILTAKPIIPILEAAIISIIACIVATSIPLRRIHKISIVDSIEAVE